MNSLIQIFIDQTNYRIIYSKVATTSSTITHTHTHTHTKTHTHTHKKK